jgi:hypothetical protein
LTTSFDHKTNRTLSVKEIAAASFDPASLPQGMEPGLFATAVYKAPVNNYPNGCHICELEIDRETGKVDITRYSVVDDFGTVLNPLLLHGQVRGGVAQGAGQALMEDIHFDSAGQLVTASFMDYAMPHAHDLCDMEVESRPGADQDQPARRQRRGRGRLRRRAAGGDQCAGRRSPNSASNISKCRPRPSVYGGQCALTASTMIINRFDYRRARPMPTSLSAISLLEAGASIPWKWSSRCN